MSHDALTFAFVVPRAHTCNCRERRQEACARGLRLVRGKRHEVVHFLMGVAGEARRRVWSVPGQLVNQVLFPEVRLNSNS